VARRIENPPPHPVQLDVSVVGKVDGIPDLGDESHAHQAGQVLHRIGQGRPLLAREIDRHQAQRVADFVDSGNVVGMGVGQHDGRGLQFLFPHVPHDSLGLRWKPRVQNPTRPARAKINRVPVFHVRGIVGDLDVECWFGHA
jgi:hypothetical protein